MLRLQETFYRFRPNVINDTWLGASHNVWHIELNPFEFIFNDILPHFVWYFGHDFTNVVL